MKEETEHFPRSACADVHGQMEKCEERKMRIAQDKERQREISGVMSLDLISALFSPTP